MGVLGNASGSWPFDKLRELAVELRELAVELRELGVEVRACKVG